MLDLITKRKKKKKKKNGLKVFRNENSNEGH